MVGGGALLFNILSLNIFEQVYICDINTELINAYNVVKYNADALIDKLNAMQLNFCPWTKTEESITITRSGINSTTLF